MQLKPQMVMPQIIGCTFFYAGITTVALKVAFWIHTKKLLYYNQIDPLFYLKSLVNTTWPVNVMIKYLEEIESNVFVYGNTYVFTIFKI